MKNSSQERAGAVRAKIEGYHEIMTWGANTKTASSQSERIIMHSSRISEMLQNCNPGLNTLRKGSTVWSPAAQMALPSWLFDRYFLFALIGSSLLCFDILFKLPNFQDVPFFTFPDTTVATTIFLAVGAKVERVNKKKKLESINNFALPEWSNSLQLGQLLGIRVFQWYHQLLFAFLFLYLFNLITGVLLSFIFWAEISKGYQD